MTEKKIIAYVDGYNLYEGCQSALRKPKDDPYTKCYDDILKTMWYDPRKIVRHCGEFEGLDLPDIHVKFYTSPPLSKGGKYKPQHYDRYTKALEKIGVDVVPGEFRPDKRNLNYDSIDDIINELEGSILKRRLKEGQKTRFKEFLVDLSPLNQKEKQTDVNLAIDMVTETDIYTLVLVSMDSDFDPVIKKILKRNTANLLILLPPTEKKENQEARKKAIQKTTRKWGSPLDKDKIKCIDIKDIEKCALEHVKRRRRKSDRDNMLRYCGCVYKCRNK